MERRVKTRHFTLISHFIAVRHLNPHFLHTSHSHLLLIHLPHFFTLSRSRLLLISQTDVTVRAQLEEAMARLTATQLSMLCQV